VIYEFIRSSIATVLFFGVKKWCLNKVYLLYTCVTKQISTLDIVLNVVVI